MRPKSPGAINGGMMKLRKPYSGPIVTILVEDITQALSSIESHGGKTSVKWTEMGQYGHTATSGTEGNLMGLFEAPKM